MATPKVPPHLPGLIDAHCHLDYAPMSPDLQACFDAGTAAGVVQYVHVGCSPESIDRAVALADAHPQVFAVVGVHPHEAKHTDAAILERLRTHAKNPNVVAIGETGLDYHYDLSPRDDQRRSLAEHVELARDPEQEDILATSQLLDMVEHHLSEVLPWYGGVLRFSNTCLTGWTPQAHFLVQSGERVSASVDEVMAATHALPVFAHTLAETFQPIRATLFAGGLPITDVESVLDTVITATSCRPGSPGAATALARYEPTTPLTR